MRLEKRRAGPFLRDNSTFSPKTVSDSESTFPRIYKKILSRDTKQLCGESFPSENALVYYLFFFRYLFSTLPEVCQNKKKSFTLYQTLLARNCPRISPDPESGQIATFSRRVIR